VEVSDERLTEALTTLAVVLLTERTLKADLERLARLACRLIPGCTGGSVALLVDGEPTTVAVTDRVALEVDMVQYDNSEGPCIRCVGGEVVRVALVAGDERFPHFAAGAADRRVQSVLSTPVIDHGTVIGTLNLYGQRPAAFDTAGEEVALVIAAEVANAVTRSTFLARASTTRDALQAEHDEAVVVSRAQGAVMAMHDTSAAQALDLIRNAAATNDERLAVVAERILGALEAEPGTA